MKRALLPLLIGAFTLLIGLLPLFAQPAETMAATAIVQDAFRLTPTLLTATRPIVVDAADSVSVAVTAASRDLEVKLIAPSGTEYIIGAPATTTFESGMFPIDAPTTRPGATYLATLQSPQPGTWSLAVRQPTALTAPLDVVVLGMFNNDTRAVLVGGGDTYPSGTDVRLALVVFDGTAKTRGLTIDARLFRPGDATFEPVPLQFRDDGTGADERASNGIYEAFATALQPGHYQVHANATGTASTGAFRRTTATLFKVVARKATIDTLFSDRGIDLNGDTLLDMIGVTPRATILEAGTYSVAVRLRGSNGKELLKTLERSFPLGPVAPEVVFRTSDIASELGVNGPYQVAEVRFLQLVGSDLVPADIRYNLGATAAYQLSTFQRPRLRLSGTGSATGVDFNANGRYDQLNISIGVIADFAGWYSFSVSLSDVNGKELGFRSGSRYLSPGTNQLTFSFTGFPIGQNGVNGPYFLSNFLIYGAGQSLRADTAFTTPAFLASQFEGFVSDNIPPSLSVTVTPSVLYPPNHKMVEITPTIQVSDNRDPDPKVDLISITSNEGDDVRGDGRTSPDVYIDDNGRIFLRAERSGLAEGRIYTLTWRARDDSGNTSTTTATVTAPHNRGR